MNRLFVLLFVGIVLLGYESVSACTIFSASDSSTVLGGNNGDYSNPDTYLVFYPAQTNKHGRVYAGWREFWWQTGMNDQGLFFASASAPYLRALNSTHKPSYSGYLMYKCMEECATVDDVLTIFDQYNLEFLEIMQLLVADATGASVIIEGDTIHYKQQDYQVVTNFRLSQYRPPYPCWRYDAAVDIFENTNTISVDLFTSICDATHQEGQYPTQFSTIYDLQQQNIYLYHSHNYDTVKMFDLADELQQGYHTYHISTLFSSSNPPVKPATPNGVTSGKTGIEYTYTTMATDPDNDQLYYLFDWGDGTYSEWLGPYVSGEECHATNTWTQQGNHGITVKAKDTNGAESEWSNPLSVSMPYEHHTLWDLIIEWVLQLFGINTE